MSPYNLHESAPSQLIPQAEVSDFASAAALNDPNIYPGERPADSYLTDGANVYTLSVHSTDSGLRFTVPSQGGEVDINDYLSQQGVASMEDRIPVLAFGANVSPGSLLSKFTKVGRPDALIIPTVYAELPGYDVVWSGGPGINGNLTAALYKGEETQDTAVQVGINFLTREQLLVMHATELSYNLSAVPVKIGDTEIQAYYYAGADSIYTQDGHPVAVESIPANGRSLRATSTRALMDQLVADRALLEPVYAEYPDLANATDSEGYIQYTRDLFAEKGKGARLVLKRLVSSALAARGLTMESDIPEAREHLASWANPSTLATYGQQMQGIPHSDVYLLPQQEIPVGAWADEAARQRVLMAVGNHLVRTSGGELKKVKDESNL